MAELDEFEQVRRVCQQVAIPGALAGLEQLVRGHLHKTYIGTWHRAEGPRRYIHQRINHEVFRDVALLMRNIERVTTTVRAAIEADSMSANDSTLVIVPTKTGALVVQDTDGSWWRTYEFIEDTVSVDVCSNAQQAEEGARALGRFTRYAAGLSAVDLGEPIPGFQNTAIRWDRFEAAVKADAVNRVASSAKEISMAQQASHLCRLLPDAVRSGRVPLRVTHADPKLNNVLFSAKTGRGVCVVDLDTCMPGTLLYDFGDLVRCTSVPVAEDCQDLEKARVDLDLFRALAVGYLSEVGRILTPGEWELLASAPASIAHTLGIRFLTDHLQGDRYFHIRHEGHNLERARTQMTIAADFLAQKDVLDSIVAECRHNVRAE